MAQFSALLGEHLYLKRETLKGEILKGKILYSSPKPSESWLIFFIWAWNPSFLFLFLPLNPAYSRVKLYSLLLYNVLELIRLPRPLTLGPSLRVLTLWPQGLHSPDGTPVSHHTLRFCLLLKAHVWAVCARAHTHTQAMEKTQQAEFQRVWSLKNEKHRRTRHSHLGFFPLDKSSIQITWARKWSQDKKQQL